MRKFSIALLSMYFLLVAVNSFAEIFTWIDKAGKKHYGDQIPAEYANQAKTVDLKKANAMEAVNAKENPQPLPSQNQPHPIVIPNGNDQEESLDSCKQAKLNYDKSLECFRACTQNQTNHHNVSQCSCTDIKKPAC